MNYTVISVLFFIFLAIIFILLFYCISKVRFIEKRLIDLSYEDVQVLIEQLKDLLIEAERVAEKIDLEIKEKEDMLADLSELLELKLIRMEELVASYGEEEHIRKNILEMAKNNIKPIDIAKRLGIPSAEVELMLKFNRESI
jgi:glycine cleavage system regulatory protein